MMNVMNYQEYDVILDVFDAIEKDKFEKAEDCLASNFSSTVLRKEVKKEEFLDFYRRIKEGMPDAKFEIVDLTSDGDSFKANIKIKGTHSHEIPSLKKGWKKMKPTGKKINKIVTSLEIVLRGDRIIEIKNIKENHGVISGILDELNLLPKNYSGN